MTPSPANQDTAPSPLTISFLVVTAVFLSVGLLFLYLYKCHRTTDPSPNPDPKIRTGLDPSLILAFPTLIYSAVKRENSDLECAICLSEFDDVSILRLITICHHVFHRECVDLWLESHTSCPVCRTNLDLPPEKIPNFVRFADVSEEAEESVFEDAVSVQIESETAVGPGHHRWHSTGHSITKRKEELGGSAECKYTLRLPENVKVKVTRMGHGGRSATCGGCSDRNHQLGLCEVVSSSS